MDADLELSVPVTKNTAPSRGVPQCPLVLLLQLDVLRVYELIIMINSPRELPLAVRPPTAVVCRPRFLGAASATVTGYYVVSCHCRPRIIMMMPPRRAATRLGSSPCRISTETTMSNKGGSRAVSRGSSVIKTASSKKAMSNDTLEKIVCLRIE